jgi:hypothetical protein
LRKNSDFWKKSLRNLEELGWQKDICIIHIGLYPLEKKKFWYFLRLEIQKVKICSKYGRVHSWENNFPKDRILLEENEFQLIFENSFSWESKVSIMSLWEELWLWGFSLRCQHNFVDGRQVLLIHTHLDLIRQLNLRKRYSKNLIQEYEYYGLVIHLFTYG